MTKSVETLDGDGEVMGDANVMEAMAATATASAAPYAARRTFADGDAAHARKPPGIASSVCVSASITASERASAARGAGRRAIARAASASAVPSSRVAATTPASDAAVASISPISLSRAYNPLRHGACFAAMIPGDSAVEQVITSGLFRRVLSDQMKNSVHHAGPCAFYHTHWSPYDRVRVVNAVS